MSSAEPASDYVLVVCPTCHARLHPARGDAGKKFICPDCGVKLVVPRTAPQPAKSRIPSPAEIGDYDVREAIKPPPPATDHLMAQGVIYARPVPAPPRWTFFSGVFQFPWYPGSLRRWIYLCIGFEALGLLVACLTSLGGSMAGGPGGMIAGAGLAFFGMSILWTSVWTFSLASACLLAVVQETAAGNDEIDWPDADWRSWVWGFVYLAYMLTLAGLAAWCVAWLAQWASAPFWPVFLLTLYLLFPIVLLSSLEANSAWVPASPVVLRSLLRVGWAWAMFYVESALLACAVLVPTWWGFTRYRYVTVLVLGPIVAALVLIYARLLGRLAWRATLD